MNWSGGITFALSPIEYGTFSIFSKNFCHKVLQLERLSPMLIKNLLKSVFDLLASLLKRLHWNVWNFYIPQGCNSFTIVRIRNRHTEVCLPNTIWANNYDG